MSSSVSPANDPESFAVGAVDALSNVAYFSSRGPSACDGDIYPRVVTPGVSVRTSDLTFGGIFPNSYMYVTGTSFAAPHVSGAMALLLSAVPGATVSELQSAIADSAVDLGSAGPDNVSGAGRLDVIKAYDLLGAGDPPPPQPGSLHFSEASYSVAENGGSFVVKVTRTGGSDGTVGVDYASTDGTAAAGEDYEAASGTLTFAEGETSQTFLDGETSQTFALNVLDDTDYEGDENLILTLSNPTGGATLGEPGSATVTIIEDDPPPGPADDDSDGFTADVDCNDNDDSIYPGAPEIKHDGIDQDCNGYDLAIDITRARYLVSKDKIIVWATSGLGDQAGLKVTINLAAGGSITKNMTWKATKSRWQKAIKNFTAKFGSQPVSVAVFGVEGSESQAVELR
jgi:hypothetical protein